MHTRPDVGAILLASYGDQHTTRGEADPVGKRFFGDGNPEIIGAVQRIAADRGVPMAQVALARVLNNSVVSALIVGATKPHHLTDAVAALDLQLTDTEIGVMEAPYVPQLPAGF